MKAQIGVGRWKYQHKHVAAIAPNDFIDLARIFQGSARFWLVPGSSPERAGAAIIASQYRRAARGLKREVARVVLLALVFH